jgi:hypothetical protein
MKKIRHSMKTSGIERKHPALNESHPALNEKIRH